MKKIVLSATKQSIKAKLPIINKVTTFDEFINRNHNSHCFIAHCISNQKKKFKNEIANNSTILIGPEGDFSNFELEIALKNNYTPVSLGNSRLRTETAGVIMPHNCITNDKFKLVFLFFVPLIFAFSNYSCKIAVLKYNGGGDWYANPSSLNNLIQFCQTNLNININPIYDIVNVESTELYRYPFIHMTGHGNVTFSISEAQNLRSYLIAGGFLHIDDNYGLDPFIRPEMKKVFPELDFIELPFTHPIYHQSYNFENGLPKIHEHDNQPARGYGLIYEGRLICFYSYESDLGDGWEDPEVHKDSNSIRISALKMGANIIQYSFTN